MKTNELIEKLSADVTPVAGYAVPMRLAGGIVAGAAISFLAMWAWLGIRPDLAGAAATSAYWIKFLYTLALAICGLWAAERLARPAMPAMAPLMGMAIALAILIAIAGVQLMDALPGLRMHLIMGSSASVCPWRIVLLSIPIFAGTFWSLKGLAPTRLVLAGSVSGFAAGALGAWIYAFHCDESAAPFVLVFYTLAMVLVSGFGALIARRVLRW